MKTQIQYYLTAKKILGDEDFKPGTWVEVKTLMRVTSRSVIPQYAKKSDGEEIQTGENIVVGMEIIQPQDVEISPKQPKSGGKKKKKK